ncbi:hypothetical protein PSA7680_02485 [Pseudoruegeria aquimaris]|uniref:Phosphonate metabolism protein n=1 Tax=Pseudoruegeria aquimaris TaxID=393663 RepID=A0A1Y5STS2_9RHOB|nr:DUF1045 domain-containing protein [Pseudoruegeria aquimaris]SLN48349.1 hypothetical protein PSA7680_02485 [Pseudoruegeria aquimaris]
MRFRRYAIYYTPETGPLASFGATWLGWDSAAGRRVAHPPAMGLPLPVEKLTERPRKYGFHGTLKPPFRMADGQDEDSLIAALETFAQSAAPVWIDALELARIGGFVALVPKGEKAGLSDLAARVVTEFDGFRAPPTPEELARRRSAGLTPAQDVLLARWGYPYVMDEFRFHLTLTSPMPKDVAEAVRRALTPIVAPFLPIPFIVAQLTLLGEAEDGFFHEIKRFDLTG